MSEWIKELEERAKQTHQAGGYYKKGDLSLGEQGFNPYIDYDIACPDEIELKGEFTSEQLQDLVSHMKKYKGE